MKKNILRKLAAIANTLDDLKYHKESSAITSVFLKIAQLNGLGWDLPAGAANDPNAPYNQDNSEYDKACGIVNDEIEVEFIPAVKEYYYKLTKTLNTILTSKGSSWAENDAKIQAVETLFNHKPFAEESKHAYETLYNKCTNTFGEIGARLAEDTMNNFSEFAMMFQSPEESVQNIQTIIDTIVQPHYDNLCENKEQDLTNYTPEDDY